MKKWWLTIYRSSKHSVWNLTITLYTSFIMRWVTLYIFKGTLQTNYLIRFICVCPLFILVYNYSRVCIFKIPYIFTRKLNYYCFVSKPLFVTRLNLFNNGSLISLYSILCVQLLRSSPIHDDCPKTRKLINYAFN